tara:strand:+ start:13275 stop:13859 length:585 start_codon:yes stop_codon:yes gene_type:complete
MGNLSTLFPPASSSNLLEIIQYVPDGRTFQGASNNYTAPTTSNYQSTTTSYVDVQGSNITYTPPNGTRYIRYELNTKIGGVNGRSAISNFRLYVAGTEVEAAWKSFSSQYYSTYGYAVFPISLAFSFDLTAASDDIANGKFSNWTGAKEIKWMVRAHDSNYDDGRLNFNYWRDGTGASGAYVWNYPLLTVSAYS